METAQMTAPRAWKAHQSLNGEWIAGLADGKTRVRARIRRNAYDEQSFAILEAWTDAHGWVEVTTRPIGDMEVSRFSHVTREDWTASMVLDLDMLLDLAGDFFGFEAVR